MALPKGKSLTPEQNQRVRDVVRELLALPKYGGNVTALSRDLGISQAGLSSFLSARTGAGMQLATALSRMKGWTIGHLMDGVEERLVAASESTRPVWKNLPEWRAVSADAVRRNAVLREHPQAVGAAGETASLFISGPLTPDMVTSQALFWLQHGDPAKLEEIEAEEYARVDAEIDTAVARAARASKIHNERVAEGKDAAPPHQIALQLERREKALSPKRARPANESAETAPARRSTKR